MTTEIAEAIAAFVIGGLALVGVAFLGALLKNW